MHALFHQKSHPESDSESRSGLEAFAFRDFRRFQFARLLSTLAVEAQAVAVAWQVYSITHRPIDLGYTGLALFLPGLLFLLPAGHTADRFDRRHVVMICFTLQLFCTVALLQLTRHGVRNVLTIYIVLFMIGVGRAFASPASTALLPHLVPEEHFVNAVTWSGAIFQLASISGPALGGLLFTLPQGGWMLLRWLDVIASWILPHGLYMSVSGILRHGLDVFTGWMLQQGLAGAGIVYVFTICMLIWYLILVGSLHVRPGRMEHRELSLKLVLAGFRYVMKTQLLVGAFSLDLFVVLLGGAVALLPIFAHDILNQGPIGLGMLRAAPSVGAVLMSLYIARHPLKKKAGVKLFICVGIFGLATILFGISRNLWISLLALAIAGAADTISVVIRAALTQLATPPEMRGRVSAVNSLFIGASNELGAFESGLTAQWLGAVRATILGGVGALVIANLWAVMFPELRNADALTVDALKPKVDEAEAIVE